MPGIPNPAAQGMTHYSVSQLKQAAYNAGFRGTDLITAVAISLAENSSRDATAISPANHDGSHDHGAWQINDKAHADLMTKYKVHTLQGNADAAYQVYKRAGNSFRPWVTYNDKKYSKNLSVAQSTTRSSDSRGILDTIGHAFLDEIPGGSFVDSVTGSNPTAAAIRNAGDIAGHLLDPAFWKRLGIAVLGIALAVVAILIMVDSNKTVRGTVAKVA